MKTYKYLFLLAALSVFSSGLFSCLTCKHEYVVVESSLATCKKMGYEKLECKLCNKKTTKAILKGDHVYEDIEIIKEATCAVEGLKKHKCIYCGFEEEISYLSDDHEFEVTYFSATCEVEEYNLKQCLICKKEEIEVLSDSLGHSYGDWITSIDAQPLKNGLQIRKCSVCNNSEEKIIPSTLYINLDILTTDVDTINTNECTSFEDALKYFDAAIFRYVTNFKLSCNFDYGTQQNLFDTLVNNSSMNSNYYVTMKKVNNGFNKDTFVFNFDYSDIATKKSSEDAAYEQYNSVNYQIYESSRNDDFNDFKLYKDGEISCNVDFSDQLVYVLERGIIPIVKKGSTVEVIYEKVKDVLRTIIDDSMSDYEKIKAIHDYLILNVTYDKALLDLAYSNVSDINCYNGFYLEGVFIDNLAVCDGISKAFSVMCNLEGIPCVSVQGTQVDNPNGLGHAWNKVFLDGKWYIVDVTSDGTIVNQTYEILSYEYFLISNDKFSIKYIEKNYTELICDSDYESYKHIKVTYKENFYDCYIESFNELVMLIKCFEATNPNKSTVQFYIAFDYGTSILDELQSAYASLRLPANFSHIKNDNIITIIK